MDVYEKKMMCMNRKTEKLSVMAFLVFRYPDIASNVNILETIHYVFIFFFNDSGALAAQRATKWSHIPI